MAEIGTASVRITPDMAAVTGQSFRSKMARVGKVAGAALAGLFVIEAKKAIDTTNDLTKSTISLHENLGLSAKMASEFAGVLKARGADTSKLGMAFKTLSTQISAANDGSASSIAMFKELGFTQDDIKRALTDTEFAVAKVSDGLAALPRGADKATISGKLFGRGWQTLAPVLRDGSAAMQEQLDTVEKYGGVIQGKTLKAQKNFLAAQRESKIAWQGLQVQLATHLTPVIEKADEQFQHIARVISDPHLTSDEKFSKVASIIQKDFDKGLEVILARIPEIASEVGQEAPKVAFAFVKGFADADAWGQLAIGAFLISKLGGWGAIRGIGTKIGGSIGAAEAEGMAATTVGGDMFGIGAAASRAEGPARAGGSRIGRVLGLGIGAAAAGATLEAFTTSGGILDTINGVSSDAIFHGKLAQGTVDQLISRYGSLKRAGESLSSSQIKEWEHLSSAAVQSGAMTADQAAEVTKALNRGALAAQHNREQLLGNRKGLGFAEAISRDGKLVPKTVDNIMGELGHLPPSARKNAADTMVGMAKVMEQKGELPIGTAKILREGVSTEFSDMKVASVRQSAKMMAGVVTNFVALEGAVTAGLNLIGKNTNEALRGFGVKALKFTLQHPGKAGAQLGRFAGALGGLVGHRQGGPIEGLAGIVPGTSPGDKHVLSVDGVPLALTEAKEGIFVGNRTMMERAGYWNEQIPRRQAGGYVDVWGKGLAHLAKGGQASPYRYPFPGGASSPTVDMGIDVGGFGNPIAAIGAGHVSNPSDPFAGYGQGGFSYKMDAGAPKGYSPSSPYIYVYEHLRRTGAASGHFDAGDIIAKMAGGIEMGFAARDGSGRTLAQSIGEDVSFAGRHGPGGTHSGQSFLRFVTDLAHGKGIAGGGGAMVEKIKRVLLGGPDGPFKSLGQAALDKTVKAANAYISRHAPKTSMAGISGKPGKNIHSLPPSLRRYDHTWPHNPPGDSAAWAALPTMPFDKMAELAEWAGLPGITMANIAYGRGGASGESGGKPGSLEIGASGPGGSRGVGLWGITPPYANGFKYPGGSLSGDYQPEMFNPVYNAIVSKQMAPSGPNIGVWHGGRGLGNWNEHYTGAMKKLGGLVKVPWFGGGGQITANRPTLLGIGERGRETATVTKGGPGSSRPNIHLHFHGRNADVLEEILDRVEVIVEEDGQHHRHLDRMG